MSPPYCVLEELEAAYAIIAEVLRRTPRLRDCHLDHALLVLAWSIQRVQRSQRLRPRPRQRDRPGPF